MKIDGRCHCGYVTFEAEADPETTTMCNCTDCQTMSGAPLRAVIVTRPGTFVLLSGKPTEYRKTADSGNVRPQGFCPQCGTALYSTSVDDSQKSTTCGLERCANETNCVPRRQLFSSLATAMDQRPQLDPEIRQHAAVIPIGCGCLLLALSGHGVLRCTCPLLTQSGHSHQGFDDSRSTTWRAMSAGASSGIGNTELTLISPST